MTPGDYDDSAPTRGEREAMESARLDDAPSEGARTVNLSARGRGEARAYGVLCDAIEPDSGESCICWEGHEGMHQNRPCDGTCDHCECVEWDDEMRSDPEAVTLVRRSLRDAGVTNDSDRAIEINGRDVLGVLALHDAMREQLAAETLATETMARRYAEQTARLAEATRERYADVLREKERYVAAHVEIIEATGIDVPVCGITAVDAVRALVAERDAMRADAARLDWLEANGDGFSIGGPSSVNPNWFVYVVDEEGDGEGPTLRAAIDAARGAGA